MIQRLPITSREQWLAMRKQDVTASAIAAVSGLHPFISRHRLYLDKTGRLPPEEQSEMLEWRLMLEPVVPSAVKKQRPEWTIVPATEYLRDREARIGATPDFYIQGDPRGLGVLQAKTASPSSFRKHWSDGVPFYVSLQNATELMLEKRAAFGVVAVVVIQPHKPICEIFDIERHAGVEAKLRREVERFWEDVAWGNEPDPDAKLDADLIALMYPESREDVQLDLRGDNYLTDALAERARLKAEIASNAARVDEIENELRAKMGDAVLARFNGFVVTNRTVERDGYTVAPTRYRKLHVADLREKEIIDSGKPVAF
jgi:predicted phage-related endonuclease